MGLIRNGIVSLQSFFLGFGILSYLFLYVYGGCSSSPEWILYIKTHPWIYLIIYFVVVNVIVRVIYCSEQWMVAVCGCFLGTVFGAGMLMVALDLYQLRLFGCYVMVLSMFHFSEYFITAATNPTAVSLDSYLLNHSVSYWLAASASWLEYFLELWFVPSIKLLWYISALGAAFCIFGEITRKSAMITAQKNFNHIVQVKRQSGHKLVTHGVYGLFRHPSYVGWFWWSIGTQVLLVNPVCMILYTAASWMFFNERVHFEEMTLINFFEQDYLDYQKKVGTGLPFIKGFIVNDG